LYYVKYQSQWKSKSKSHGHRRFRRWYTSSSCVPCPVLAFGQLLLALNNQNVNGNENVITIAASAVGARFLTGTLPCPRLPTAPAVTFNQNVNGNENQKAMAIAASAVGARFLSGTLPRPRLWPAPAGT